MRVVLLGLALAGCVLPAAAQDGAAVVNVPVPKDVGLVVSGTKVGFSFVPRDPARKAFEVEIAQDGRGWLRYGAGAEQPVSVSEATVTRVNKAAATVQAKSCETKEKHIAQTGKKTLSFVLGPSLSTCSFNYSDDAAVNDAANAFLGMEQTVQMGEELARLRRFDRLGLDAEIDALKKAVDEHYAIEVGNIAPVLEGIVADERVMERVRRKAARLLEDAGVVAR